jgi:hypothetical protein
MSDQPLKPVFPNRPFLFADDYPAPVDSAGDAPLPERHWYDSPEVPAHVRYNAQRARRVDAARLRQSGPLAQDWDRQESPCSPAEAEQERLEDAAYRAQRNGLPDSPEDMPAVAVSGGLPFKFS